MEELPLFDEHEMEVLKIKANALPMVSLVH
jgi:hypothetical protein